MDAIEKVLEMPNSATEQDYEAAYCALFKTGHSEENSDSGSLAQPNPMRYVPSMTTDNTGAY